MNELEELRNLLRLFLQASQDLIQIGEEIPDQVAEAATALMQQLYARIEQLEESGQSEADGLQATPTQPNLETAMPSSNIEGFSYDDENKRLLVRFLGDYPNKEGPIYSYEGVPPWIFNIFKSGSALAKTKGKNKWGEWWVNKIPSIGAAMNAYIKNGGFPYQRVS